MRNHMQVYGESHQEIYNEYPKVNANNRRRAVQCTVGIALFGVNLFYPSPVIIAASSALIIDCVPKRESDFTESPYIIRGIKYIVSKFNRIIKR